MGYLDQPRAASKSAVSRRFVQLSQEQLAQWLARPIGELDLPVVTIDGIHFRDRVILLALGIDAQGHKHVLGLREGLEETLGAQAILSFKRVFFRQKRNRREKPPRWPLDCL